MADRADRLARAAAAVVVAALVGWAFYHRYRFLASSPYPVGIDGYFYPIQLRELLADGALYYKSSPLALWLMAPLAALTDPVTGAKLGAALGGALLVVPVYFLGRRIGASRAVGIVAAVLVATSAESFYLSTEFVKNGIALTVAAAYLSALLWALEDSNAVRASIAGALFVGSLFAHKAAFAFAVISTLPPLWLHYRDHMRRNVVVVVVAVAVAVLALAGILFPERFLGAADLALLGDLFTSDANWSLPALDWPGNALHFRHEVAIAGALAAAALAIFLLAHRDDRDRAIIVGPALMALVAALPWLDAGDHQGLTFRLRLMSFVPLALCASLVLAQLLRAGQPLWRRMIPEQPDLARAVIALGFAAGVFASMPSSSSEGVLWAHPAMQAAVRTVKVPDDGVVIVPERHILYMVTWYTGAPARLRPEPVPPARRWRLLPGAHLDGPVRTAIDRARREPVPGHRPRALHSGDRNGLVLVDELTWQWILERLPPKSRRHYQAWPTI
jgi:hypothetical protein